jgi:hypothetical protein
MTTRIESALTMPVMLKMPLGELANIATDETYTPEDRLKAVNGLHARSRELNGGNWLSLNNETKEKIRKAMALDATGVGFQPLSA